MGSEPSDTILCQITKKIRAEQSKLERCEGVRLWGRDRSKLKNFESVLENFEGERSNLEFCYGGWRGSIGSSCRPCSTYCIHVPLLEYIKGYQQLLEAGWVGSNPNEFKDVVNLGWANFAVKDTFPHSKSKFYTECTLIMRGAHWEYTPNVHCVDVLLGDSSAATVGSRWMYIIYGSKIERN